MHLLANSSCKWRAEGATLAPMQTPEPPRVALVSAIPPQPDPNRLMRTCANCGSEMEERKCKLICRGCGYFLSCSDYY